jgi:RimJ/RimL family protein N-acetyltransferase
MQDPSILEATGSEPLSMEEEIEMQKSWLDDPKKCTFIVLAKERCHRFDEHGSIKEVIEDFKELFVEDHLDAMVGDVNLFLSDIDDDDDEDEEQVDRPQKEPQKKPQLQAEIDIMIAEKEYQKKGLGRAATSSMLLYGAAKLGVHRFFCKINEDNVASIRLFESLGFVQCDYAACFKQVELELVKPLAELERILLPLGEFKRLPCPAN